MRMWRNWQTR